MRFLHQSEFKSVEPELRAMSKKFFQSALVKRPLPSAMFEKIDRAARLSWSTKLVNKEPVTTLELFGGSANCVCKIDRFLVDEEFLEGERRGLLQKKRAVSRK